ncbi:phage tail tape measure protein [Streptomyces salyersiae]|uniref:Phage tail tape measure protein n=1 Tax=Streptomyces salyersiae TaxID=3075530 RepID=A0ABU2RZI0_9ACTN|nr:phage tail tape measure protein [Streptomyces sp. DSM 41770]MDT0432809.1 phage tail tape measure protein [Streptomyces sp. DSM 41770]
MALTVGELLATITVDDSPAQAGMNRARAGMRSTGDGMTADADRAGRQAGGALGDGVADGAGDGAERGGGLLRAFGWAAVGAVIGGALMAGMGEALSQQQVAGKLQAQLGTTGPVAAKHGKVAGALYAGAIVESVEDGAEVIRGIAQNGLLPPEATQAQITTMGRRVADTASVMGEDVGKVSRAVGTMLKSGVAKSADEAMDILVKGTQKGVNSAEDLLDTFSEYPTQFRDLGLDAQTAMGLMQQGLQGGARDADTVADALKEFAIRSKDMSTTSVESFEAIGLNADKMAKVFTKGGPEASAALGDVLKRLKAIKDPAERNATAVGLFGTKAEDLQQSLFALDPSTAVKALGDVKGATDAAGNAMRDNAATKIEMFKRAAMQGFVEVLGAYVIPALIKAAGYLKTLGSAFMAAAGFVSQHSTAFGTAAAIITVLLLPALVRLGVQAATTTAAVVTGWISQGAASVAAGARFIAANAVILAGWIAQAAGAVTTAATVVASWVLMGVQSMVQAARMAAAWVLAMGPVGWVIAAIVALVALVVANWDTISEATGKAWDWVWEKIKGIGQFLLDFFLNFTLVGIIIDHWDDIKKGTSRVWTATVDWLKKVPGMIVGFFLNWSLVGTVLKHWDSIKTGTARKATELVSWVKGLPGRLVSAIGDLGSLLYNKGTDIVRGLLNGVKSMGPWLAGQLTSFAKNMVPGPIAKALGIASPSKVMAKSVGRWIPAGIVKGIEGGKAALSRTMSTLVTPPDVPALVPGMAGAAAYGGTAASNGATVRIEHWHAAENGSPDDNARALEWLSKGRG